MRRPPRSHAPHHALPLWVGRWVLPGVAVIGPVVVGWLLHDRLHALLGEPWWIVVVAGAQLSLLGALTLQHRRFSEHPGSPLPALDRAAREFPRIRNVRRLLRLMTHALVRCLGASHATIYLQEPQHRTYGLAASAGSGCPSAIQSLDADSPLIRWLLEHRQPLRPTDCPARTAHRGAPSADPYRRLRFVLQNLHAGLILPSFRGPHLLGFLVLGERPDRHAYTDEEIASLTRLARDCAVALENARSYEALHASAEKLESAKDRLLRQERMVAAGRLAMGLAHEIKNPLAAIKTFSEFLPERYEDAAFRDEFAKVVGKEVDRISRIVQSLSDFAKPVLLKVETTDVQHVLRETVLFLWNECLKRNIATVQDFEPNPILLPADPNQLKQAFLNLCMNALEAMPTGGKLTVRCGYELGEAVVTIADTGSGIDPEHLKHLFDPFFTTKQSGMGLGLSVVKQIIDQHVGTISVESRLGEGTTFTIRLPLAVRFTPHRTEEHREASTAPHRTDGLKLDLLVVDDEPRIGQTIKACCEAWGCSVRVVENGEDALRTISQWPPQLLLLDLTLEELNGFEVLRRVKLAYPALPVVIITGTDDPTADGRVTALGAASCLHKPIDMATLRDHLVNVARSLPPTAPPATTPSVS